MSLFEDFFSNDVKTEVLQKFIREFLPSSNKEGMLVRFWAVLRVMSTSSLNDCTAGRGTIFERLRKRLLKIAKSGSNLVNLGQT